ncbi:hypothetical protein [Streptomyces nodosus]|uniref:Lipoprotein n=1 Tax=Streptomyces nodosus TaxID=40318 RepID=A0A0B5DA60_9ACTN|nr:hypothetical protein [Streptomyces nodosus]AJE40473.1 hypothetical protein SNOD_10780 [Streptomyces nodosus]MBB4791516.1 hypothetical protein [Streptomyces nodosus]QEV39035.1 hypothetical protein CP978_11105 [Streptomyces nodosus]
MPGPIRALLALALCGTLVGCASACARSTVTRKAAVYIAVASPSPSTPAERRQLARTRFATNAGLAAGATDRWIVRPSKAGAFKKGRRGRTAALVRAHLAGTYAYHRLEAARRDSRGDPRLSKALTPLGPGIDALGSLPARLRKGDASAVKSFDDIVTKVRDTGRRAGTPVRKQNPTARQLAAG